MQFEFTEYQKTAVEAIDHLVSNYRSAPVNHETYLYSAKLDEELVNSGFLDIAAETDLGGISGAHLVMEVAKLPFCNEIMASTLIRQHIRSDLPRPIALGTRGQPIRFATIAKTALIEADGIINIVALEQLKVEPVATLFAYPYGRIPSDALDGATAIDESTASSLRVWQRIGLAAEIYGALHSALRVTVDHVTQRQQFGRPIGSNQAVQHRLAEVAMHVEAIRWLTYQAAASGKETDAAVAATYAQSVIAKAVYDLHQFSGAMGLTLEHSLHLWTYRLRALVSEMGGPAMQAEAVAALTWENEGQIHATR